MSHETLNFKIGLSANYWGKKPQFSIWIDDRIIVQTEIHGDHPQPPIDSTEPKTLAQTISFDCRVEDGDHLLKIRLENKTMKDTVVEDGRVVKDMVLNIDDITIDDISLGNLLWGAEYVLDYPQIVDGTTIGKLNYCVNLGWNGTYILKFSSPLYIWLLEKL